MKQNVKVNRLIQYLLKSNLHKFDVDSKFKVIFDSLKMEIHNLEAVLTDPENIIYMEIRDLKRQVNLDRENLISQIDKQANDLI